MALSFEGGREIGLEQKDIALELKAALDAHVVEIKPHSEGNSEKIASIGDASFGTAGTEINRCDPFLGIDKISLEVGKSVVIIGPNGSGKTTIFDAVMDLRNADFGLKGSSGGTVYGKSVHGLESLRIARLNQEEILGQIGDMLARKVLEQAAEYFKQKFPVDWEDSEVYERNMINQEAEMRIDELGSRVVKLFGMEDFLDRKIHQLSGGERTKMVLVMMLAAEPDVLLLDEPTNHLDMESIAKLAGLFELYKKAGVSIASVSHVDWFLQSAGQDGVIECVADENSRSTRQSSSSYKNYVKDRSGDNYSIISGQIGWRGKKKWKAGKAIVQTTDVVTVPESPLIDIEFPSIQAGEVVFLSGSNGTGKTKLMEALVAGEGEKGKEFIKVKGVNIAYMPQFWPDAVVDGTLEGFFDWIKDEVDPHSQIMPVRFAKEARGLNFGGGRGRLFDRSWLKRPLSTFSGGEQRLLWFLSVSTLEGVDALCLDEPTNHMDRFLQKKVTEAIQSFPGTVIISSHDVKLMDELSTDVGNKIGSTIKPRNLVLNKEGGRTTVTEAGESPAEYAEKVRAQARNQAKRFKL